MGAAEMALSGAITRSVAIKGRLRSAQSLTDTIRCQRSAIESGATTRRQAAM